MSAEDDFEAKRQQKEDEQLGHMVAALSDNNKSDIYEKGKSLWYGCIFVDF